MDSLTRLLWKLKDHFPNPPASEAQIRAYEQKHGFQLPADARAFFATANGASLFRVDDPPFRILPLDECYPVAEAIMGEPAPRLSLDALVSLGADDFKMCPDSWIAIADVLDGNYLAIDLDNNEYPIMDCFHETFPIPGERNVIAMGFTELLQLMLESGGKHFYLDAQFKGYGYV